MKQFVRAFLALLLAFLIFGILYPVTKLVGENYVVKIFSFSVSLAVIFGFVSFVVGIIFYFFFSGVLLKKLHNVEKKLEDKLISMNFNELVPSLIGSIIGLVFANLIGLSLSNIPFVGVFLVISINIVFAMIGFRVARIRKDEFKSFFGRFSKGEKHEKTYGRPKIFDTSVIIDGRILDILNTGFIEGKVIIPDFVLEELRHIADSSDALKRKRGRRGLDILNEIQKNSKVPVEIVNWDKKDTDEVDTKLLKMGRKLDAFVVTNDFNLNKVAEFQKVSVLNVNELSRSVKTVVLPGEAMKVTIIKDGKENRQGIAYLDDGTMIVVENGVKFIGETKDVTVTSVLQTAAGRMIFAKIKVD